MMRQIKIWIHHNVLVFSSWRKYFHYCRKSLRYDIPQNISDQGYQNTRSQASKQPINSDFSKTSPSRCCFHGNIRPHNLNSTTSLNCQINLRKSTTIWKGYFKLSEIVSCSKLARESKAPPSPLPPGGIGLIKNGNWKQKKRHDSCNRIWQAILIMY